MGAEDWSAEPIIDWLIGPGRQLCSACELTAQLSQRFVASGVSLSRMRLTLRTLHPLVLGSTYTWWAERAQVEIHSPPHSIRESPDYRGSPVEYVQATGRRIRCRLDSLAACQGRHPLLADLYRQGVRDYVAFPLYQVHNQSYTAWILATNADEGFAAPELDRFERIAGFLAPVVEVLSLDSSAKALLEVYLGKRSGHRVLQGQIHRGDGELIEAVIWYCDLRDFTAISESLEPRQLLALLNVYFELLKEAVAASGGEVMRFIGDAMLIIFPIDTQRSAQQLCRAVLQAAEQAHREVAEENRYLSDVDLPPIRYGVGLDIGPVLYGNVGARDRLDFTVMGRAVNRAARLQELTKQGPHPIVLSAEFAACAGENFGQGERVQLKGIAEPVLTYGYDYPE